MTAQAIGCTLIVSLAFVTSTPAQAPLLWKFARGQTYDIEREATQKQSVELRGKEVKEERQSTWHIRLEVKEARAEAFEIAAVLIKVEEKLPGVKVIDPKLAEKMQGASFTLLVTPG